ncbi:MAG TPA: glycosyl hydrolase [Lacipirellula sp.]
MTLPTFFLRFRASRPVVLCLLPLLLHEGVAQAQYHRYEAETAQILSGVQVRNSVPGYSGAGYVTDFTNAADYLQLQVNVPDGLYEMWVGYRSQFGQKGYTYRVDGETGEGMFDQSHTFAADRAGLFNVRGATNTLAIQHNWGYYDIDYFEFRPFTPPQVAPVSSQLADEQASARTRFLMNYLVSIYGEKTLSGQQHDVGQNLPFPESDYLAKSGGLVPAIRGSDLMDYSPSRILRGENPQREVEQTIDWAKQTGGIVTMTWHWNAPANLIDQPGKEWWRGFYTNATTFDLPGALANPQGGDYQLILRDIDAIAAELQKFENAGVPVIWRPLHEAQGGWFWWGAHGPETFKQLWNLTHDRLTNHHGLHNLIWEFTSSAAEGNHLQWYPGDSVVDMIGLDIYTDPSSSMSGQWHDVLEHYNGRKLIALSETGTLPDPELMDQWDIEWSYFSPWNGFDDNFTATQLRATLEDEDVITLDELPTMPWSIDAPRSGDFDADGDVDGGDLLAWQQQLGQSGDMAGDGNGDDFVDAEDLALWRSQFRLGPGVDAAGVSIPEPGWAAFAAMPVVLAAAFVGRKSRRYRVIQSAAVDLAAAPDSSLRSE